MQCDAYALMLQVLPEQHVMQLRRLKSSMPEAQHCSTAQYTAKRLQCIDDVGVG